MASYAPITTKEQTESLSADDKIIIIQNGQVKQLSAGNLVAAINLAAAMETAGTSVGSTSIAAIGDGTLTGAIAELKRSIDAMPTITSGSNEPTGGEDNDIHIMFEE